MTITRGARRAAAALMLGAFGACSSAGSLGSVLGTVLGGGQQQQQSNQLSGLITGVDTRAQQIGVQQSNGQSVGISYDNQTRVMYQNQNYPVTSLERGDRVTMRVQSVNNGYYTDLVQVDQSVSTSSGSTASGAIQNVQGSVRQVDRTNGLFSLDVGNGTLLTVSMPYAPSNTTMQRFQNLRVGDNIRIAGVYLNNTRVELRQFY